MNLFFRKWNGIISLVILLLISAYAVYEIRISTYDNLKECATKYSELYEEYNKLLDEKRYGDSAEDYLENYLPKPK